MCCASALAAAHHMAAPGPSMSNFRTFQTSDSGLQRAAKSGDEISESSHMNKCHIHSFLHVEIQNKILIFIKSK